MKNCKFVALPALALVCALGTAVVAAPGTPKMGGPAGGKMGQGGMRPRGPRMAEVLGLTPAQKSKLKAIRDTQMPAFRALQGDTKLTPDQKKAKFKSMRTSYDKKILAILTPAQKAKFASIMKERRSKMGQMGMARKPA